MKKLFIFLIMLLLLPITTFAADIKITNIEVLSKSDTVTVNESTHDGLTGNLNFKVSEIGDSIKYKITIKNESNEDFNIKYNTNSDTTKYFDYTYTGDTKIEPGKEGTITIKVDYVKNLEKDDVEESEYANTITLNLTSNPLQENTNNIVNPNTGLKEQIIFTIAILFIVCGIGIYYRHKTNPLFKTFIFLPLLIIPFIVDATDEEVLKIKVNSIVEVPTAVLNVAPRRYVEPDSSNGLEEGTNRYTFDEDKIASYEVPLKYSSIYDTNTVLGYTDLTKEQLDQLLATAPVFEKSDTENINAKKEEIIYNESGVYITYVETSRTITYEYYATVNHTDEHKTIPMKVIAEYDKTTGKVRNVTTFDYTIEDIANYIFENNTDKITSDGTNLYYSNGEIVTNSNIKTYAESETQDFIVAEIDNLVFVVSSKSYLASGYSPLYSVLLQYDKSTETYIPNLTISLKVAEDEFIRFGVEETNTYKLEPIFVYQLGSAS